MKFYCYKITNTINNKVYIGITNDLKKRWREHRCASKTSKRLLYRAMRKHLFDNFKMVVIGTKKTWNKIALFEIETIKKYNSTNMNKGYNLSIGGEGAFGIKRSKEQVEKQKKCASIWSQSNIEYLKQTSKKQMSNPKNRELSRNGAKKQWEEMDRKELEVRQERLSKESKNRWRDNSEYRKLIVKANSKAVIIDGIKYQSITKATKIYGLANNTISARCRNPKFPNFNFVDINENNK